jgi:hypothetical protein
MTNPELPFLLAVVMVVAFNVMAIAGLPRYLATRKK